MTGKSPFLALNRVVGDCQVIWSWRPEVVIRKRRLSAVVRKGKVFWAKPGVLAQSANSKKTRYFIGTFILLQGLKEGDVIVVSGQNKLSKAQMPIKAVPAQGK